MMRPHFSGLTPVLTFVLISLVAGVVDADIALPKLFADHMVLQQNQTMRIHGTADAEEKLTVQFGNQKVETVADQNGDWSAVIRTGPAGGPFQLEVASQNSETKVVFNDVLVGEVWICSGQSNMGFPVHKTTNATQDIEDAKNYPKIRGFNVGANASLQPLKDFSTVDSWFCCSPDAVKDFSAIAYLFGRELYRELDIPIGLIHVSSDGTTLESWTPYEALKSDGSYEQLLNHWEERNEPMNPNRVSNAYNAMIAPLSGFAFRGVIWYQGEANLGRGAQYRRMFPLMIQSWRKNLGQPSCPFLFVQPTPFRYQERPVEALPEIWDAQLKTLNQVPATGMVVATDLASTESNQPADKFPIAQRLSYWAFSGCYADALAEKRRAQKKLEPVTNNPSASPSPAPAAAKGNEVASESSRTFSQTALTSYREQNRQTGVVASGPLYEKFEMQSGKILIRFKMMEPGFGPIPTEGHGVTVCGEDKKFLPADVKIVGKQLVVTHPDIPNPVAVRYGWTDTAQPTLKNSAGLPASPFRTDDFPLLSEGVEF